MNDVKNPLVAAVLAMTEPAARAAEQRFIHDNPNLDDKAKAIAKDFVIAMSDWIREKVEGWMFDKVRETGTDNPRKTARAIVEATLGLVYETIKSLNEADAQVVEAAKTVIRESAEMVGQFAGAGAAESLGVAKEIQAKYSPEMKATFERTIRFNPSLRDDKERTMATDVARLMRDAVEATCLYVGAELNDPRRIAPVMAAALSLALLSWATAINCKAVVEMFERRDAARVKNATRPQPAGVGDC